MDRVANLPLKIPTPWASGAKTGYVRPVPNTSQIGAVNGAASFIDGFVPLNFTPVSAGGVPPFGSDMNGVLKQITEWERWGQAGGPIRYDPLFQTQVAGYPAEARVGSNVTPYLIWQSTANNNMSNPDTGGGGWQTPVFPDVSATNRAVIPGLTVLAALPATNTSMGAAIAFVGNTVMSDGITSVLGPNKWLRVYNGTFGIVNSAYTAEIFSLTNTGDVSNIHNLTAGGAITGSSLVSHGDAAVSLGIQAGTLTVYGAASTGNLTVNGSATVHGNANVDGTVTANSVTTNSITVGYIHGTSNVQIDGSIIANGNITALGSLVGAWIHSTGYAQIDRDLAVTGYVTAGNMHSTGSLWVDSNVQVNGSINATYDITAQRDIAAARNISTAQGVYGGYIASTGNINASNQFTGGSVAVSGNITGASIGAAADIGANGNGYITGRITAGNVWSNGPVYFNGLADFYVTYGNPNNRYFQFSSANGGYYWSWQQSDTSSGDFAGDLTWYRAGFPLMRLTSSRLHDGSSGDMFLWSTGAWKYGGGQWLTYSDESLKNIGDVYTGGLTECRQLTPHYYSYRQDMAPPGVTVPDREFIGVSVQDIENVIPEAAVGGLEPADVRGLDQTPLIYAMLNAIKELDAEVQSLKAARAAP